MCYEPHRSRIRALAEDAGGEMALRRCTHERIFNMSSVAMRRIASVIRGVSLIRALVHRNVRGCSCVTTAQQLLALWQWDLRLQEACSGCTSRYQIRVTRDRPFYQVLLSVQTWRSV